MNSEFSTNLQYINGYRANRLKYANIVLENPYFFSDLIQLSCRNFNEHTHKACWILEFVCYQKLEWMQPHLDLFIDNMHKHMNESAIRPMSKIGQLLVLSHFKKDETKIILSDYHLQKIIETCFDWLISETKVATKVYAMRTLYLLGNHNDWIIPELKEIITKDYPKHSSAYKAVTREILKKIK